MTITRLEPAALFRACDVQEFHFETTAELEDLGEIIGQPRAVDAVKCGVNEKIEGFFDACQRRGLSGDQGVIIPGINVKHLMLREDVRAAVEAGKFSVYAIDSVDDGIELLTGLPAGERDENGVFPEGSVNRRVEDTLAGYAEAMRAFVNRGREPDAQEPSSI
jgi:hypothetical protein